MACLDLHWIRGTIFFSEFFSDFRAFFGESRRIELKSTELYWVFSGICVEMGRGSSD